MERIDVGGHTLRVDVAGAGPPDFLCLHGLVDALEIWDRLAGPLAERGRVARFDQRGHGESDAPPGAYRREDLAADALAVLDGLGVERAVWVGHSLGGVVAMAAALAHPERVAGLVLIGTASHCSGKAAEWYERIASAGETDGTDGLRRAIYGEKSRRRIHGDAGGIARVARTLQSLHADPLTPKLPELGSPALLLVGENDPMGPKASAAIAAQLPDATLEIVPGCGHWLHVEAPDVVIRAYDGWTAGRGAA
ncbi:MAG: alpha/beta fold hydrolase [Myxococcota bacterium]